MSAARVELHEHRRRLAAAQAYRAAAARIVGDALLDRRRVLWGLRCAAEATAARDVADQATVASARADAERQRAADVAAFAARKRRQPSRGRALLLPELPSAKPRRKPPGVSRDVVAARMVSLAEVEAEARFVLHNDNRHLRGVIDSALAEALRDAASAEPTRRRRRKKVHASRRAADGATVFDPATTGNDRE
jgi:hypothetical protein